MRNLNRIVKVVSFIFCFSCSIALNAQKHQLNGIYQTKNGGKQIYFSSYTNKSLFIDTVQIVSFHQIKSFEVNKSNSNSKSQYLTLRLSQAVIAKFAKVTKENFAKPLAIILKDNIISAPIVFSEISDGVIKLPFKDDTILKELIKELNIHN